MSEKDDVTVIDIRWRVDPRDDVMLADGRRALFDAVIVSPPEWAGQVRDIIIGIDGGVSLGPDLNPNEAAVRLAAAPESDRRMTE